MAKKNAPKQGNRKDFFDTRSGRVLADLNFADQGTSANLKSKIAFIREAFPLRSKDDIALILQSCDYDVEAAFGSFTNGEAENILKEWSTQGKKSKNGNSGKKKRNKKKRAQDGEPDPTKVEAVPQERDLQNDLQLKQSGCEVKSEDNTENTTHPSALTLDCPSPSLNLLHPPSPSISEVSLPSSNSDQPTDATPDAGLPTRPSPHTPRHSSPTHAKYERMVSTGPDALKKTVKDLHRSSVSLARFQLLLEEECDMSFKTIAETFKELKQCLKEREDQLHTQMEEFKKQAVELLEQRQENAAALKLKSERVGGMVEAEVTQLRNEIKNFVTERKIDEELARTTRFVGDKEQLLGMIKNFGIVTPIKSCYSPVILNPPSLPTKKVEIKGNDKKPSEPVRAVGPSAPVSTAVPTIALPAEEHSAQSHKALQEVAQLHAKLQAALQQQGLSSSTGNSAVAQKQSRQADNKRDRPSSSSQALTRRQTPRRPQSSLPQNQQRKGQNQQRENLTQVQSAEPKGSQHERRGNQPNRNSRRGYQRQPPRNTRSEPSNEKVEMPKEQAANSSQSSDKSEQQLKPDEEKQAQSEVDKVKPQQSELSNKEYAQSENRGRHGREQRDGGGDRSRNRNRRRGGRSGATEGQNERGRSKGTEEKIDNGPQHKGPSETRPLKESPLENEEKKGEVKDEGKLDVKVDIDSENTEGTIVSKDAENYSGEAKSQDVAATSGRESGLHSKSTDCLNGGEAHEGGIVTKKVLPQRQDRGSRRRGGQRDRKSEPSSRPTPNGDLSGDKPIENGVGHSSAKEGHIQSGVQETVEDSQNQKSPVVVKETKIGDHLTQEHEKVLNKPHVPMVNGYITVQELNEVSIGR